MTQIFEPKFFFGGIYKPSWILEIFPYVMSKNIDIKLDKSKKYRFSGKNLEQNQKRYKKFILMKMYCIMM